MTAPARPPLAAVPSLDDLLREPHVADSLPRHVAAALLPSALQVVGVLLAQAMTPGTASADGASPATPGEVEWIGVEEVGRRFGLSREWLEDHAADLRGRGLVSAPSRKVRLYNLRKLRRYIEAGTVS